MLRHKAAAFDSQIQRRPDPPEVRRCHQQTDNSMLGCQPFHLIGACIRVVGDHGQRAVLFRHRDHAGEIQKGSGKTPEQVRIQMTEYVITIGKRHAPLLSKRPVEINLFQIQPATQDIQYPFVFSRRLGAGIRQCRFGDHAKINQNLFGVTVEIHPAQGSDPLQLVALALEHGDTGHRPRPTLQAHQVPALAQVRQKRLGVLDEGRTQNQVTGRVQFQPGICRGLNNIHIMDAVLEKALAGFLHQCRVAVNIDHPVSQIRQHGGHIT